MILHSKKGKQRTQEVTQQPLAWISGFSTLLVTSSELMTVFHVSLNHLQTSVDKRITKCRERDCWLLKAKMRKEIPAQRNVENLPLVIMTKAFNTGRTIHVDLRSLVQYRS